MVNDLQFCQIPVPGVFGVDALFFDLCSLNWGEEIAVDCERIVSQGKNGLLILDRSQRV